MILLGLSSCRKKNATSDTENDEPAVRKRVIVTTTTMVTDLVRNVAGDLFEIKPLMQAGVDPHLYKATPDDMAKLSTCDLIIYGGLHLEGRMVDVFHRMEAQGKLTIGLGDSLPASEVIRIKGAEVDPHIWGDAKLWSQAVPPLVSVLTQALPSRREEFEGRGRDVQKELMATHEWMKDRVNELPRKNRVLITSHDAFRYFGRAYGFEVVGVQGISTDSEAGLNDIARVVDTIKQKEVKAVFIESSVSPATIKSISKDSGALIGGELLSDACELTLRVVLENRRAALDEALLVLPRPSLGAHRVLAHHELAVEVEVLEGEGVGE